MEQKLKDDLVRIGTDLEGALDRCMDSEELYVTLLGMFLDDANYAGLHTALAEGNLEDAYTCAHTLKGLASNIGLDNIIDALMPIFLTLKSGSLAVDATQLAALDREYALTVEVIKADL